MPKFIDLTGKELGRLKVLKHLGKGKWECKCQCGNITHVGGQNLRTGMTKSCGCIHKEQLAERNRSHGFAHTPMYNVWSSMKARCFNESDASYKNYGARGITVSDDWLKYENFHRDMYSSYKKGLTLERVDNNKGYDKDNCVWATPLTQCSNTRRNVFYTIDGVTGTQAMFCRKYNMPQQVIYKRISRGWTPEDAYKTPIKTRKNYKK